MAPKQVWADFVYKGVVTKAAKAGTGEERYHQWECPHCGELVDAIVSEKNNKRDACIGHFWNRFGACQKRPQTDLRGQRPAPKSLPPAAAPAPQPEVVVGQPLSSSRLVQLEEELAELRVQSERHRTESERHRNDNERYQAESSRVQLRINQLELENTEERVKSERRKRERSELYHQVNLPSPHSSDGEQSKAELRKQFDDVTATATAPKKKQKRKTAPSVQEHAESLLGGRQPSISHMAHVCKSRPTGDDFSQIGQDFKHVTTQEFARKHVFVGLHGDKHLGDTKDAAKRLVDHMNEWTSKLPSDSQ